MPTYAPPPVTFVRGEGTQLWDVDGKRYLDFLSGLAVTSLGHSHPVVADALQRAGEDAAAHVEPVRHDRGTRGRHHDRRVDLGSSNRAHRRAGVLLQFGCRGERVRHQARPQVGRARPSCRGQRVRVVPRPHAGDAARHRPTGEARGVLAAAGGIPARGVVRCRRVGGFARSVGVGRVARARAGRGRRQPRHHGVLRRGAADLRRAGPPVHGRRGADRIRTNGGVVRLPALRRRARRGDDGQGTRQRRADRRVLGAPRRGRGIRAGRSRDDVRRHAAGDRRGEGRARRDAAHRCAATGAGSRSAVDRAAERSQRRERGARPRPA